MLKICAKIVSSKKHVRASRRLVDSHVFYIHNQSYKNVTIDFVFVTRSMRTVIICCCCCFSAHRSHFACFSRVRGDDVFVINFGC